ncbi:MAG: FixH family protein [Desulfurivibrio sp.]|nr:FixH family protein [Desulfurivibrio sp.]
MSRNRWQLFLGAILLAFLVFSGWTLERAASRVSAVSDVDYYRTGQRYHQQERAWRAAAEAGWRALLSREAQRWRLRLLDRDGAPVTGGEVVLKAVLPGNRDTDWRLLLPEVAPGVYQASSAVTPSGTLELILSASRDGITLRRRFKAVSQQWAEVRL